MEISAINPFVRAAEIQPAVLEGASPRLAYDHRIFLIMSGNGTIFIKENEYPISADSVVFIPPETEYYFRGKMKVTVLNFDLTRAFQNQRKPRTPVPREVYDFTLHFDLTTADGLESPFLFSADEAERESILRIVSAFASRTPYSDARTSAELKGLIARILEKQTEGFHPIDRIMERVMLYIRANAAEIRDNTDIGKALGYHPVYLSSLVKAQTGKTLHRVLLEERVRLACRYLRSTGDTVEKIAYETGFSSRNHFCTAFRSIMGTTPLAYRKK